MRDRSTEGTVEYLIEGFVNGLVVALLYNSVIFKNIPGYSTEASRKILYITWFIYLIFCTFVLFRKNKTLVSCLCTVLIPVGGYTIVSYYRWIPGTIQIIMTISIGLSLANTVYILSRRIKHKRRAKRIMRNRMIHCIYRGHYLIAAGMTVITFMIGYNALFRGTVLVSNVKAQPGKYQDASKVIEDNVQLIKQLRNDEWNQLSVQEKLDLMQIVANIEASALGISTELNVATKDLDGKIYGQYNEQTHMIYIDVGVLESESSATALDICCHEAYHAYQYRLIDLYKQADSESKNLRLFGKVNQYAWEFQNYKLGDSEEYYNQMCEVDARAYAQEEVSRYSLAIREYYRSKEVKGSDEE